MAWNAPFVAVDDTPLTAAQINTYIFGNLNETAPAKATTAGGHFVATGTNGIAQRITLEASISDIAYITDTSWTDASEPGPSVSPTCSGKALVFVNCRIDAAEGHTAFAGYEIDSGA